MTQPKQDNPELWSVYLLLCDQQVIYTGIAKDPAQRLLQHQAGAPHGAKFTRRFTNLELVYQVQVGDRSTALKLELILKKRPARVKQQIIQQQPDLDQLASWLGY